MSYLLSSNPYVTFASTGAVTIGVSASTATHVVRGAEIQLITNSSTAAFLFSRSVDTGSITLLGGAGAASGSVKVYGSTHASKAGAVELEVNAGVALSVDTNGGVAAGLAGALATGATTGHFYVPSSAGAPTGVPASKTGKVAFQYDTTNNRLYAYNGAWRMVAVA